MNNFQLLLLVLTSIFGLIYLLDIFSFLKNHLSKSKIKLIRSTVDYSKSLFPVLLIVFIVRSFVVQPFRIPTGSLEPTIKPNDFVVVSQFKYGVRLPIINKKIINVGTPKRGDIVVFRYPLNNKIDYIKRVVGVPGDRVKYENKILYINGKKIKQKVLGNGVDYEPPNNEIPVEIRREILNGVVHNIYVWKDGGDFRDFELVVPDDNYFVMGDNRDNSADSRYFGFVPDSDLIGKALMIWFSWDSFAHKIRWNRIGNRL